MKIIWFLLAYIKKKSYLCSRNNKDNNSLKPKSRKGIKIMKTMISVNGKQITTNTEFRQAMNYSESGTRYILAEIDGEKVTLRKHWSFDGDEWDVWSGHEFETMKRLNKSVIMSLVGEPMWYTNEEGTKQSDVETPFDCDWGHYNVEFNITND